MGQTNVTFLINGFHPPWNEASVNLLRQMIDETHLNTTVISVKRLIPESEYISTYKSARIHYITPPWPLSRIVARELPLNSALRVLLSIYFCVSACIIIFRTGKRIDYAILSEVSRFFLPPVLKLFFGARVILPVFFEVTRDYSFSRPFVDAYLCMSSQTKRKLISMGVSDSRLFDYIPRPLVLEADGVEFVHEVLGRYRPKRIALYLGSLTEQRFPRSLLQRLSQLSKDLLLLIVAPRTVTSYYYLRSTDNVWRGNSRVKILLRNLSDQEKASLLSTAHVALFPFTDNATVVRPPLTLLEALVYGCIPIVTRTCSMDEIVTSNVNGFVVDRPNQIIEIIRRITDRQITRMRGRGRKRHAQVRLDSILDRCN